MHIPVLLNEALYYLSPKAGDIIIDATFGAGGYTKALLQATNCKVIAFDRDQTTTATANAIKQEFGERFDFYNTNFSNIANILDGKKVDAIVADFGVSSMQLDEGSRGFSFLKEAKLDMRMNQLNQTSAFHLVNSTPEPELAEIILKYGEERLAKKIASHIVRSRAKKNIETTLELAKIIEEAYGSEARYTKIHPATKTFQAIRIAINNEIEEIETLLNSSLNCLNTGGRLVCVSFHSLEDGIVKHFMNEHSNKLRKKNKYAQFSKLEGEVEEKKPLHILTPDIILPTKEEISSNIRSRSARLRAAILV